MNNFREKANLIWGVADLLRGEYKQADYGKVILPLVVLKRLDEVLAPTKEKVLHQYAQVQSLKVENIDPILNRVAGLNFHNKSKFDFQKLLADPDNLAANLRNFITAFSSTARDIIEHFQFDREIITLDKANLLYLVIKEMNTVDLHPSKVSSMEMGYIFEELIRKFAEASNETAGEHFTPREVIRLMVNLLFVDDSEALTKKGIVKTLYDPACGTGGMLSIAEEYLHELNPDAQLELFGQELNPESYAICKSDMLIKGQNANHIKLGNSFTQDQLDNEKFDYMLSNPPFGVEWKKVEKEIKKEHEEKGGNGRFGAGLPRINDGSFLFLQHMISKMKPTNGGTRIGIVFNGAPLSTGGAGSGESEIRRWIIENDWLETVIAMPTELFYNTDIATYIWIVTNRKGEKRKGKIQLINVVSFYKKLSKSLGDKRNEISDEHIKKITRIYDEFTEGEYTKIFDNDEFGYWQVTIERPLKDENGNIALDKKGNLKPDLTLRDTDNISLKEDIDEYFKKEVLPYAPDAWMDRSKDKKGYSINLAKYFYKYEAIRSLSEITNDILKIEERAAIISEVITNGMQHKVEKRASGIKWLDQIPNHWDIVPFFALFKEHKVKNRGNTIKKVLSLSYGKIVIRNVDNNFGLLPESFEGYNIVEKGNIVLRLTDLQNDHKSLRCGLVKEKGIITSAYTTIECDERIDPEYAYYVLYAYDLLKVFYSMGGGVRQSIGYSDLKNMPILLPPYKEQLMLVKHVSSKLAEVDSEIAKMLSEINLLHEYRTALISEVITGKNEVRNEVDSWT